MKNEIIKQAAAKVSHYVPNFINRDDKKINWLKLLFWANIAIVVVLLTVIYYSE